MHNPAGTSAHNDTLASQKQPGLPVPPTFTNSTSSGVNGAIRKQGAIFTDTDSPGMRRRNYATTGAAVVATLGITLFCVNKYGHRHLLAADSATSLLSSKNTAHGASNLKKPAESKAVVEKQRKPERRMSFSPPLNGLTLDEQEGRNARSKSQISAVNAPRVDRMSKLSRDLNEAIHEISSVKRSEKLMTVLLSLKQGEETASGISRTDLETLAETFRHADGATPASLQEWIRDEADLGLNNPIIDVFADAIIHDREKFRDAVEKADKLRRTYKALNPTLESKRTVLPDSEEAKLRAGNDLVIHIDEALKNSPSHLVSCQRIAELTTAAELDDDVIMTVFRNWEMMAHFSGGIYHPEFIKKIRDEINDTPLESYIVGMIEAAKTSDKNKLTILRNELRTLLIAESRP